MSLEGKATAGSVLRGKINSLDVLTIDAYGVAVRNGFEGTEEEWLASLQGEQGEQGEGADMDIAFVINLLNSDELTPGVDLGGGGEMDWGDGYTIATTGYISVVAGDVLSYQRKDTATGIRAIGVATYLFCDGDKVGLTNAATVANGVAITAPANAEYVRFCLQDYNSTEEWAIVKDSEVVPYVPYGEIKLKAECLPDEFGELADRVTGLEESEVEGAVLYTEQTLTEEQKAQARANIGAGTGDGGTTDPYNDYQPDVPENIGVLNAILNFKQIAEVPIVAKKTIPQHKGDFTPQATPYYGLPYSSSRIEEGFVPNFVSLETFMTSLQNPNSYLYTVDLGELGNTNGDAYYGSVCSVACAYALNIEPNYPTHQWQDIPDMETIPWQSVHALKLGDTICHHTSGHVVMVTDITRNKRGKIGTITISEARYRSVLHNDPATPEEIAELYPTDQYGYFRYNKIHEVQHTPSPFVAVEDETPMEFPYNTTLIPRKGDKANWLQGVPVEIDLLETANYTTAEIYKDDVLYDTVAIKGAERPVDRTVYGLGWYAIDSKTITTTYIPSTDIMVSVADGVKAKVAFHDAALGPISNTTWRTESFSTEGIVPDGAKVCRVVVMLPDESAITDIEAVASKIGVSILPDTNIMPLVLVGYGLSSDDGSETADKSTRLRSGFQPLQNVVIAGGNDVQYYLYFYDANKAYIRNNRAWLTGTTNVLDFAPSGTAYYRLLVKNNAGTSISAQNGIYAQEFTLTILGGVPDGELNVLVRGDLPYGSYKARLTDGTNHSDWCYWIVVDAACSAVSGGDGSRQATVTFSASNAEPLFVKWAGGVDNGTKHINPLTDEEKEAGTATVKYETAFSDGQNNTYKMRVGFKTEYGIIHTPLPEAITV